MYRRLAVDQHSFSLSFPFFLSYTFSLSLFLPPSPPLSLSLFITFFSHLSLSVPPSLSLSITLSLCHTHTLSLSHTHTHTHTHKNTHTSTPKQTQHTHTNNALSKLFWNFSLLERSSLGEGCIGGLKPAGFFKYILLSLIDFLFKTHNFDSEHASFCFLSLSIGACQIILLFICFLYVF